MPWPESLSSGEIIRRQRELTALPMRQLAAMAGISNPYLSHIEHGLREPSEQVLKSLRSPSSIAATKAGNAGRGSSTRKPAGDVGTTVH